MIITGDHIVFLLFILPAIAYAFIVLNVLSTWKQIPEFRQVDSEPETFVSIIIPARNEENNLITCLDSLVNQNYPTGLFEIIVVDDYSTDKTALLVQGFALQNSKVRIKFIKAADIDSLRYGKKNALKIGIDNAIGKLIVTTDADCQTGNKWLRTIVCAYKKYKPKMIIGPVAIYAESAGLEFIQQMEMISLSAFTAAYCFKNKPVMCNGANLAYERAAFDEVKGFEGIDEIASGDDVLLMNKFKNRFDNKIMFLKSTDAIVTTKAVKNFMQFINQRIRWSSKGFTAMSRESILVAALVSLLNTAIIACLFLSFFYGKFASILLMLIVLKTTVDYVLLRSISNFFNNKIHFRFFISSQLVYPIYISTVLIMRMRKQYIWKGRKVK